MPAINRSELIQRRLENFLGTCLLLGSLATLAGLLGYLFAGWAGLLWTAAMVAVAAAALSGVPATIVLRRSGALPLAHWQAPRLYQIASELARRAELKYVPLLHYIPDEQINAFAVGSAQRGNGGIAITEGLLRALSLRETAAVIAHELSHLRHGDTRMLALASFLTNAIVYLGLFAQLTLLIAFPWLLEHEQGIPLISLFIIVISPTAALLLQLSLSRNREYAADLEAVALTGDPEGLAQALEVLEHYQSAWLESIFGKKRRLPLRHRWLSSHPPIQERIRRLQDLTNPPPTPPVIGIDCSHERADGWVQIPVRRLR
ncbi:zinc metalloprotease HtpX [Halorhodospira halochloris]|uniref:Peptidase M48 n=1 Tax=Halorhodospira halochloris TaxID=1052 RepID=A0A0X8XBF6_HALHR|nr:zinc metalloprotease HtpX [Halorhodospira halochloris]MBK1650697.1 hypothetical protein [Halorhodospira halochloris]MCG5529806.1 zinc metalloprotease HtpX [Halorhodospira halochloris]BAU56814.1 peptidase M48 [Halorhodospira halochloris]